MLPVLAVTVDGFIEPPPEPNDALGVGADAVFGVAVFGPETEDGFHEPDCAAILVVGVAEALLMDLDPLGVTDDAPLNVLPARFRPCD